jgi:DNA repair protein RadA/Sms
VDSIQTLQSSDSASAPGSASQLKIGTQIINDYIKSRNIGVFLIGHVTKEGVIAGPKVIEHLVDTVLYFDQAEADIRLLRASKNRFGATDEIGIFRMTGRGLQAVKNPGLLFLEHREGDLPAGVAICPVYEGSRILLVEIQSLVVPAKGGISRVFSDRIDSRRVSRIAAVLEKHVKVSLSDMDVYVNVAGGIQVDEVAIDLALAMALYSARTNMNLSALCAILGEVSLAGEIRGVAHTDRRIKSAKDMGFRSIIGPVSSEGKQTEGYRGVGKLSEAMRTAFS